MSKRKYTRAEVLEICKQVRYAAIDEIHNATANRPSVQVGELTLHTFDDDWISALTRRVHNIKPDGVSASHEYEKDDLFIKAMAADVKACEDKYDYSMRTVYLDRLVCDYTNLLVPEFIKMFEYVFDNQKDDKDSYGDIDTYVSKLRDETKTSPTNMVVDEIMNSIMKRPAGTKSRDGGDTVHTRVMYLRDNPSCAEWTQWLICKQVEYPSTTAGLEDGETIDDASAEKFRKQFTKTRWHVRHVKDEPKNKSKLLPTYWDLRDEGGCLWLKSERGNEEVTVESNRGMLHVFTEFYRVYRNLQSAYYELKDEEVQS